MLQNAAKSMSILWVTWEKRVVVSGGGGGTGFALQCLRMKVCVHAHVCVCVWMRRADNWTAARSPGHPAAVEKLLMANAELLPVFHKN